MNTNLMNQEMTRLLATRLGLSQEEAESLRTGGDSGRQLATRLAERFSDPFLGSLFNSMFQGQSEARGDYSRDKKPAVDTGRTIQKMQEDLAAADMMAGYIADVFGACPRCWGLNRLCSDCKGKGKPGSREPQEAELLSWIEPALAKLGLKVIEITNDTGNLLINRPNEEETHERHLQRSASGILRR
jgi:hypothetical protein